jgi:lysozyme-related protein Hpa2
MLNNRNIKLNFTSDAALALPLLAPIPAAADCFDEVTLYHNVNLSILRAIAAQESRFNPTANHPVNADGLLNREMMSIDSMHLPEPARYGIRADDLLDSCKSMYLAGWRLPKMVDNYGNNWEAVGGYNSKTPSRRNS